MKHEHIFFLYFLLKKKKKKNSIVKFRNNIRTSEVDVGTVFSSTLVVGLVATPAIVPDPRPISPQPLSLLEEKDVC